MNGAFLLLSFSVIFRCINILLFLFLFYCSSVRQVYCQINDSLRLINQQYDSLLTSESLAMENLFYKHKEDILLRNLGPYGSPYYFPYTYYLYNNSLFNSEKEYIKAFNNLKYAKPFTNITYINASRKEQIISLKHIQNFGRLLNLNFSLDKTSSPGLYNNQEANTTSFEGKLEFNTKNNLYHISFENNIQRDFYEENGGLVNEKNFESNLFDDQRNYQVNLGTSKSFVKQYEYNVDQRLNLWDLKPDTFSSYKVYVGHNFNYKTRQRVFYDNEPQSLLYQNIFIDSINTIDSIFSNTLSNTGILGFSNKTIDLKGFYQYDLHNYFQSYGIDTNYVNTYIGGELTSNVKKIKINLLAKYGMEGYRKNDLLIDLLIKKNSEKTCFNIRAGFFETEPNINHISYTSNHFIWRNANFSKQKISQFKFDFKLKKQQIEFSASIKLIDNVIYFDSLANVSQNTSQLTFSTFRLSKNYKVKSFHFRSALIYQITSDRYILPLPEIVGRQIAYFEKKIFKKALKIQLGFGLSYSTGYYGYRYMPATSEFYVQQNKQLGYYPNLDIFLNTHLKRAQIFLKYEHINAGNSLDKSYQVPGYPQLNKSLKFGISWNLFD